MENSNEEMGFGEQSWEEISGDTLGDVGEQRMTKLGSWMAWRLLARSGLQLNGSCRLNDGSHCQLDGSHGRLDDELLSA